jgi:hypothetical protein
LSSYQSCCRQQGHTNVNKVSRAKDDNNIDDVVKEEGLLEDEDEIFVDEPVVASSDIEAGTIGDNGKPFVYLEDLHKPR